MDAEPLGSCWNCGAPLGRLDYGRENGCLKCGRPTRVCKNCRWYAPGHANACREPVAEAVLEKERPNFCDFFEPGDPDRGGEGAVATEDLRKAAEDLFKF